MILRTVRYRFGHVESLDVAANERMYIRSFEQLHRYFADVYERWQRSGRSEFPPLLLVHTVKERDEVDVLHL